MRVETTSAKGTYSAAKANPGTFDFTFQVSVD